MILIVRDDIHDLILNLRQYARKRRIGEDGAILPSIRVTSQHPALMGQFWPGNNGYHSVFFPSDSCHFKAGKFM